MCMGSIIVVDVLSIILTSVSAGIKLELVKMVQIKLVGFK